MTREQKNEIARLTRAQSKIRGAKVPYKAMTSWSRGYDEGYNDGLESCAAFLGDKIDALKKKYK
jgi:hypothetical protein